MDIGAFGRLLVGVGILLVVLGSLLMLVSRVPILRQFGHLPGDIRIEGEHVSCFFPLVSMIILSVLLSLVLSLVLRLLNR